MHYFQAIDWKEPWIMGLIAFHALVLIVKVSTSICSCSYWFKLPFVLIYIYFPLRLAW
ncbi:unnamed protein product [Brassica oleracea var. botrytis]